MARSRNLELVFFDHPCSRDFVSEGEGFSRNEVTLSPSFSSTFEMEIFREISNYRKWREAKQQLIWLSDLTLLGCCLVSLHFHYFSTEVKQCYTKRLSCFRGAPRWPPQAQIRETKEGEREREREFGLPPKSVMSYVSQRVQNLDLKKP